MKIKNKKIVNKKKKILPLVESFVSAIVFLLNLQDGGMGWRPLGS